MKLHIIAVIFIAFVLAACENITHESTAQNRNESLPAPSIKPGIPLGKLGDDAVPEHYLIDLTLNTDADTFSGKVTISVRLNKRTNSIFLHGQGLRVASVTVTGAGGPQPFSTPCGEVKPRFTCP